jgi:hypothetical protein
MVNHKGGGAVMAVMPGEVFVVKKNPTSAYVEPSMDGQLIYESVIHDWRTLNLGLDEEWSTKFIITSLAADDCPVSSAMMEV